MIVLIYIQNLITIGRVVSKIYLIKIRTVGRQADRQTGRQADRQPNRETGGNVRLISSYSRDREVWRKHMSMKSTNTLDYSTSLAFAREVKTYNLFYLLQLLLFY